MALNYNCAEWNKHEYEEIGKKGKTETWFKCKHCPTYKIYNSETGLVTSGKET